MKYVKQLSLLLMACFIGLTTIAHAQSSFSINEALTGSNSGFLSGEQAFLFEFIQKDDVLTVSFDIEDGYYLYKKQFAFTAENTVIGTPQYPVGVTVHDEYYGSTEVYRDHLDITIPILSSTKTGEVEVRFQGCAEGGLCYSPMFKPVFLMEVQQSDSAESIRGAIAPIPLETVSSVPQSEQFSIANRLINKESITITLGLFFLLGIGLGFTPCVFPMYPIVSGIVIGQSKDIKTSTALGLTFVYVQGMAITYSILGLIVASAGMQFQAALQHPVVLGVFITLFVALSLAMFGRFEIQLPAKWQTKLTTASNKQTRGSLVGVFAMGVISGLIASPCTTAPLTGILLFIAQTGDTFLGFLSLYVLSVGMGIPLMLFGATGSKLLPKAGQWMNVVKVSFGFMMLVVAILFVERLWVSEYTNLLWATLGLAAFHYYYIVNEPTRAGVMKYLRSIIIAGGILGSAFIGYSALVPHQAKETNTTHPAFITITTSDELKTITANAAKQGKTVMVDLYADWCVACKDFEKYTFPDEKVISALENTVWVQIDLTDTNASTEAFQGEHGVLGLPTILLYGLDGLEAKESRITGFMQPDAFAQHIQATFPNNL